jgi:hypothetical protein
MTETLKPTYGSFTDLWAILDKLGSTTKRQKTPNLKHNREDGRRLGSRLSRLLPWRKSAKEDVLAESSQESSQGDKDTTNKTDCFWRLDLIPDDFPNVRIMTYGYDSHPTHFYTRKTNEMNISQHAQKFLEQLTNARAECRGRPLIMVAHSPGGILVKDMIIKSGKYKH